MERIEEEVKRLASNSDESGRKKIIDSLREISYSIETPDDTLQRLTYTVSPDGPQGLRLCWLFNHDLASTYKLQQPA